VRLKNEGNGEERTSWASAEDFHNRRITVRELSGILYISDGSVKTTIKQHLQYLKVCAWWIPRLLTNTRVHDCKLHNHCCRGTSRKGTFFILSWPRKRRGCITSCPRANVLQCSGITQNLWNPKKRKPRSLLGRLWPPSSGTLKVYFTWISSQSVAQ